VKLTRPPVYVLVGIAAWFLTWRLHLAPPGPGGDPSWMAALHVAAREGRDFGSELTFQYGPLGFLAIPHLYFTGTAVLAAAVTGAVYLASSILVARALVGTLGLVAGTLATLAVAQLTAPLAMPERLEAVYLVACILSLLHRRPPKAWTAALLGAVAGFMVLVKLSSGGLALALLVVTVAALGLRAGEGWKGIARTAAAGCGGFAAAVLVLWTLGRQDLGQLPAYAENALPVILGWGDAMASEDPGRRWDYVLAAVAVPLILALFFMASRPLERPRRLALAVLVAGFLYVAFLHGFIRHDPGHGPLFFGACLLALAALVPRGRAPLVLAALAAVPLALGSVIDRPKSDLARFSVTRVPDAVATLASSSRRAEVREGKRYALRDGYGLSAPAIEQLRGGPVHYDSETGLAWAYQELDWRPVPMFQAFTTYAAELDDLNSDFLAGRRAPRFVVRQPIAVDGRNPQFESPRYVLELVCRYRQARVDGSWQLLERRPNRCGAGRVVATREASFGERVAVPRARRGEIIAARIHELDRPLGHDLAGAVFKSPVLHAYLGPARVVRFLPGHAGQPHLMRPPSCRDRPHDVIGLESYGVFALGTGADALARSARTQGGSYAVSFLSVPYSCPDG
jgi:hypothetical protein